jgi:hypothetical protein
MILKGDMTALNKELTADVVIIGGGTGGCAAALAASKLGMKVIMTEETEWIGGQLTSQAVPPDEHPWIETLGCTQSYREFRNRIRKFYRDNFPLSNEASPQYVFNPGNGMVSKLCHEPKAALAVLNSMLAPYVHSGRLTIMTNTRSVYSETAGDRILSVRVKNTQSGMYFVLSAPYFLDASEYGDVLKLADVEYVTGSESQEETGEPNALPGKANPMDMQAFTYCFAMDYLEGEDHVIGKPKDYDFWRRYKADFWPGELLDWVGLRPTDLSAIEYTLFPYGDLFSLWNYRRLIDGQNFAGHLYASDITLVNWPQNDYWLGPIIDVDESEKLKHLESAKQLSLSLLYWMQTEAPRADGKTGYPGLRLRSDVMDTEDGLAKHPYIRESRRIKAEFTVCEQHVSSAVRGKHGAEPFADSVGIGCYRIDLHPSTGNRTYLDISSLPFQIPLGSLIPIRMENLLPAAKNIGVTHITNGCYRLHPVEWNIGEAAGFLAAYSIKERISPRAVRHQSNRLEDFQALLIHHGIELKWPDAYVSQSV